jgi:hypothetical protein
MHVHLEIPEPLYAEIAEAAAVSGQSVEAVMVGRLAAPSGDHISDDFWSPDRLAELRAADADIDAGNFFTPEQVRRHFAQKSAERSQSPQS